MSFETLSMFLNCNNLFAKIKNKHFHLLFRKIKKYFIIANYNLIWLVVDIAFFMAEIVLELFFAEYLSFQFMQKCNIFWWSISFVGSGISNLSDYQELLGIWRLDVNRLAIVALLKNPKLYGLFLWAAFNCLNARATLRRQFTFYH